MDGRLTDVEMKQKEQDEEIKKQGKDIEQQGEDIKDITRCLGVSAFTTNAMAMKQKEQELEAVVEKQGEQGEGLQKVQEKQEEQRDGLKEVQEKQEELDEDFQTHKAIGAAKLNQHDDEINIVAGRLQRTIVEGKRDRQDIDANRQDINRNDEDLSCVFILVAVVFLFVGSVVYFVEKDLKTIEDAILEFTGREEL